LITQKELKNLVSYNPNTVKEYLIYNFRLRDEDYFTVDETTDYETEFENCRLFNRWFMEDIVVYER
jgi:hypothetical protein